MITSINDYKILTFNENLDNDGLILESFQDKIKQIIDKFKDSNAVFEYFKNVIDKLERMPSKTRKVLLHGVIISFLSVLTISQITSYVNSRANADFKKDFKEVTEVMTSKKVETYSKNLIEFLKYEEGSIKHKGEPVLTAYKLGDGMVTIGYGHAEKIKTSKYVANVSKITKEEAEALLINDVESKNAAVKRMLKDWEDQGIVLDLNQNMYDAIVSMMYNMGVKGFRNSEFAELLKQNKMEDAAKLIPTTSIGGWEGLKKRRAKEHAIFTSDDPNIIKNIL